MLRIGILGAGQLALMLSVEAKQLGFEVHAFAFSEDDPAVALVDQVYISKHGASYHREDLRSFLTKVDVGIFENELLTADDYEFIINELKVPVYPGATAMNICSDKSQQKELFKTLQIPSAAFLSFSPDQSIEDVWQSLLRGIPGGFMLKWAKGGYDGYGVFKVEKQQLANFELKQQALQFIQACFDSGNHLYGEELIDFQRELALVSTRGINGDMEFYPLVETIQEQGICRQVVSLPYSEDLSVTSRNAAKKVAEHLDFVGTFAVEFFQNQSGELLINELAPRVHNSGHCTLNSARASQFKNHILAISQNVLEPTDSEEFFGMINVLGPKNHIGSIDAPELIGEDIQLFWYGKKHSKPGRKVGHLNIVAASEKDLKEKLANYMKLVKNWENQFIS